MRRGRAHGQQGFLDTMGGELPYGVMDGCPPVWGTRTQYISLADGRGTNEALPRVTGLGPFHQ